MEKAAHTREKLATFTDLLQMIAGRGATPALTDAADSRVISCRELYTLVQDYASLLPSDIPLGARVILYDVPPLDWVPLFFAIARRGWITVPVDTRVSVDFFASVEELTTPALIIVGNDTVLATRGRVLTIFDIQKSARIHMEQMHQADPHAPVEILFTSGTWSLPKGVMLSQYNILTNAQQVLRVYHHQPEDISLALLPLSHAYQQTVGLILPLIVGSPIVFLTKFASDALTDALKKYEIRTMLVVPRVLTHIQSGVLKKVRSHKARRCSIACVRALRFLPLSLRRILFISVHRRLGRHLTNLVVGGAPLPLELDQFFQGLGYRVYVGYGVSECSPVVCVSLDQQRAAGEIGRPLPGVELTLNEKSELLITGENVFLGYWPSLTRPAIFNTEDVAEVDSNGSYILKGRTKNLFVDSNGYKIFFEDIEQIVAKMPDVEDCCVVSVPADDGAQLCCAVKGSTLGRGHEASLRSQINTHLPYGIRLARVIIVEPADFPYTHTLKTNRHKVQELCMV